MRGAASEVSAEGKRELLSELLLGRHRKHFPTLERKVYLNYGAQGPLPTPAIDAVRRFYETLNHAAPMSLEGTLLVLDDLRLTRAALASRLGGVAPERIALVENTSMGCNVVLWGLPWRPGDRLLLGDHEYPAVAAAAAEAARRLGFEIDSMPTGIEPDRMLDELESRLRPRTRLVLLSHVTWDEGRILPLKEMLEICRGRGTRMLIDGAQSVGVLPLDLGATGVDFYAFPAHKWLCGPEGLGGLYVSPAADEDLAPTFLGPRSFRLDPRTGFGELQPDARRFETSTSAVALCAGLRASLDLHDRWGDAGARWRRIRKLSLSLWQRLEALEPVVERLQAAPPEAGLVFFRVKGSHSGPDAEQPVRSLDARSVIVRTMPHRNCLRASVHYLTQQDDLDTLTEAALSGLSS